MDSLEERLLEALLVEFTGEFENTTERDSTLKQLSGPIEEIDQDWKARWIGKIPSSVGEVWDELPKSTRVLVWNLCQTIHWQEEMIEDFEELQSRLSKRKKPGSPEG